MTKLFIATKSSSSDNKARQSPRSTMVRNSIRVALAGEFERLLKVGIVSVGQAELVLYWDRQILF